jgi:hypothetical protein
MQPAEAIRLILATMYISRCSSSSLQAFANAFRKCTVDFIQQSDNFGFNESYINPFVNNYSPLIFESFDTSKRLNIDRILNTSITLKRTVSGLYRKFEFCTHFLVNIDFIFNFSDNNVSLKQGGIARMSTLLEILVLSKEDPHFISFVQIRTPPVSHFTPMTPYGPISIAQTLQFISFTSIFILIRSDMEAFLMCMSCTSGVSHKLISLDYGQSSTNLNNPLNLRKMWNHLHRNLDQAHVSVPGFGEPMWQFLCKKPFNLHTPENACAALAIGSVYNFTTVLGPQSHRYAMAQFAQGSPAGKKFVQDVFFRRPSFQRIIWIPFACSYNPYVFVTFFSYEHMSVKVLLEPLDIWIWLIFCIFLIFTVLCLGLLKSNTGKTTLPRRILDALVWTVSVTLEQSEESFSVTSYTHTGPEFGFYLLTSICCTGCILISFVVGLAYKTALFSCLTAKIPPQVPKNVKELFDSGLTFGTTTRHFYNGKPYSTLKEIVFPDHLGGNNTDWSYKEFIQNFDRNLVFFNGSDIGLVLNISNGLPIQFGTELRRVPPSFTLISTAKDVRSFVRLTSRYTNYKHILNNEPSPFMTRYPWYGVLNFFSENFVTALARIHESGVYDRWKTNYETYLQMAMLRRSETLNKTGNLEKIDIRFLITQSNKGQSKDSTTENNIEKPISFGSIVIVFLSCGATLITGIFVLLTEIFCNSISFSCKFQRNCVGHF